MVVDGRRSQILSVTVLVEQQHRPTNERVFVRRCLSPLRMLLLGSQAEGGGAFQHWHVKPLLLAFDHMLVKMALQCMFPGKNPR